MPLPPVTPSPRRFIVKKDPAPVRRTPLAQSHAPHPSTQQQFNATPRFTFSSTPRTATTQTLPEHTPIAPRFTTPRETPRRSEDAIEDVADEFPDDIHESIENDDLDDNDVDEVPHESDDNDFNSEDERTPKRRRLLSPMLLDEDDFGSNIHQEPNNLQHHQEDPDPDLASSSLPSLPPPQRKRPSSSFQHHNKFIISTPAPTAALVSTTGSPQQAFIKPPRFLAPETQEQTTADPLPDQFSPHRKGQKYVPGGLASEVRDWLTNIQSSIAAPAASRKMEKRDEWLVRVLIDEVSGGASRAGMTLVRGRQVQINDEGEGELFGDQAEVRVMLAGESISTALQKGEKVRVGKVVGIKGVVWEVVIEGSRWGVGVEWKVLT